MAGTSVTAHREIIAEPEQVWAFITDVERTARYLHAVESVERLTAKGFEVGTRWRETRRIGGNRETSEVWVSAIEPGKYYTVSAERGGVAFQSTYRVLPSSLGTRLQVEYEASTATGGLGGIMMKMTGGAASKVIKSAIEQDLADLAAAFR